MKLTTNHTQKDKGKKLKQKTPREQRPEDITVHMRDEGPTVQLCGESNAACRWINGKEQSTK